MSISPQLKREREKEKTTVGASQRPEHWEIKLNSMKNQIYSVWLRFYKYKGQERQKISIRLK